MKKKAGKGGQPPLRGRWWVSVLGAACCYCGLKYLVPALQPAIPGWQKLAEAAPSFAPIVTIPLLLLAAKQLYDNDDKPPGHGMPGDRDGDQDDDQIS